MSKNEENNKSENLTPFYKIYVYGEDNDKIEEIFVNPKINNTLGGHDGIYSLISSKFQNQYSPMKHTMKIKFTNYWYTINDINIYNFCVSGNLSTGENILIKLLHNTVINENNKYNDENENYNRDEEILKANYIKYIPIPQEKKLFCSLCRQNSEYLYKRLLKLFGPFRFKSKIYYAHFLCLIFIPEIEVSDEGTFKSPGKIIHDYVGLKCAFCGEKGATLCCCYNNTQNHSNPLKITCTNRFHYLCAIKSGCEISIVSYNVLCPKHIIYGFPKKIEKGEKIQNDNFNIIIENDKNKEEKMILEEGENINEKNNFNKDFKNKLEDEKKVKKNCFYCQLIINEEESIQCDKCKNYFHESCVGISHKITDYNSNENDIEEIGYICPECLTKNN